MIMSVPMKSKYKLNNARVRRMLIMVDEQVSTPNDLANLNSTNLDTRAEIPISSVTNEIRGLGDLSNGINCENKVELTPVEPLPSTSSACYNLRELAKPTVYVENDPESNEAIYSSDHSEYIPTPERIRQCDTPSSISGLSVNSQCVDKL